jgi:hypothetical protein
VGRIGVTTATHGSFTKRPAGPAPAQVPRRGRAVAAGHGDWGRESQPPRPDLTCAPASHPHRTHQRRNSALTLSDPNAR